MGLIDSLPTWLGGKPPRVTAPPCPTEADILNYAEHRLPTSQRQTLERHFAACHDCRELLVLLARFPEAEVAKLPPPSNAEVQQQTARVMQMIEASERRDRAPATPQATADAPQRGWAYRLRAPLAVAAVVICALLAGGIYLMTREPASAAARRSLAMAMKEERRCAARLSGGFEYSPYKQTRGSNDSPDFHLNRALGELRAAESDSASAEARQMLARAHLAFNRPEHARQAQAILSGLQARGVATAELFNDLGVAQLQLQNHDAAILSFSRALETEPGYAEALFNRALAYESAARYAEARRDWQQFIASATDASWKAEAEGHLAALSNDSDFFPQQSLSPS